MKRLGSGTVGIAQGSLVLFSDFADDGPMWAGQGSRERRHTVSFAQPFAAPPAVMVGLSMWDIDHRHNSRAELAAETICAESFDLVFRTWGDSRIARVRADWTALGTLHDADEWDLG